MNCAEFERTLAGLLADAPAGVDRSRTLEALRAHTGDCPECSGSRDLLDLCAVPPAERAPGDDPGADYWDGFERRVRERIDREAAPHRVPARRWLAAAAVIALVAVGLWAVLRPPAGSTDIVRAGSDVADPDDGATLVALPETLARQLAETPPDEALAQVDALAGWGLAWETDSEGSELEGAENGGLFPDVSDLDGETRQRLLQWLRERTS